MDRSTRYAVIASAVAGGIVYGSLFPFAFHSGPTIAGAVRALAATWLHRDTPPDTIANLFFYMPLGFFGAQALRRPGLLGRILLLTLAGLALSVAMEVTQLYDFGRDASMADVYLNTLGTLLGACAGGVARSGLRVPLAGRLSWHPFPALLLSCWLGSRLYPYVPALRIRAYRLAAAHLLHARSLSLLDLYRYTVGWLVVASLLETLFGTTGGRRSLLFLLPAVLLMRAGIAAAAVSPAEAGGALLCALVWIPWLSTLPRRDVLMASLFAILVVLEALAPFRFSVAAHSFGWVPFRGFIEAPVATSVPVFFEKVFTYGSLTWLLVRAGWGWNTATVCGVALVAGLRFLQVYLPGRSAEVTDALLLLILAVMMRWMEEDPQSQPHRSPEPVLRR